jgi:hypothetical protein
MVPAGGRCPPTGADGLFCRRDGARRFARSLCSFQCPASPSHASIWRRTTPSWYPRRDSNPQITGFEPAALPVCYSGLAAPREGFEPSSVAVTGRRTAVVRPRTEMKIWATGVAGWTLSRAAGSVPVAARSTFACRPAMAGAEGRRNCAAHGLRACRASPAASLQIERPNAEDSVSA